MDVYEFEKFSDNWQDLDTVLVYKDKNFQFLPNIIIIELENCLLYSNTSTYIYKHKTFKVFSEELFRRLNKESDRSIVIISNQLNQNKLINDIIKKKVECVAKLIKFPIMGIFGMKPNCFMKPHTGSWRLLTAYYKKYGQKLIDKITVVSNEGGLISQSDNDKKPVEIISSDIDRAFAHNINIKGANAQYKSIDEYMDNNIVMEYKWDNKIIDPNIRLIYDEHINKIQNPDIMNEISKLDESEIYVIMVMGAPRSGKSTFSKYMKNIWDKSKLGESRGMEILSSNSMTSRQMQRHFQKLLTNRMCVILDGGCFNDKLRRPYLNELKNLNANVVYVDINCGICMAKVFNHAHVEESNKDTEVLYPSRLYYIYNATYSKPVCGSRSIYINYVPRIIKRDSVMNFRY